jgi:hypothetical protein
MGVRAANSAGRRRSFVTLDDGSEHASSSDCATGALLAGVRDRSREFVRAVHIAQKATVEGLRLSEDADLTVAFEDDHSDLVEMGDPGQAEALIEFVRTDVSAPHGIHTRTITDHEHDRPALNRGRDPAIPSRQRKESLDREQSHQGDDAIGQRRDR